MPDAAVASTKRMGPEGRCATALEIRVPRKHEIKQRRTVRSGMRNQETGTAGVHPHFQKHGRRSHQEEGVEGSVDRLVEAQYHLDCGHEKYRHTLAGLRAHGRLR